MSLSNTCSQKLSGSTQLHHSQSFCLYVVTLLGNKRAREPFQPVLLTKHDEVIPRLKLVDGFYFGTSAWLGFRPHTVLLPAKRHRFRACDFHWEGKSRATPQKKSFRGVGISVVQRVLDCASEAWREREDDGGGDRGRGRLLLAWVGGTSRIMAIRRSKCCWRRASEAQLDRQLGQRGTGGSTLGWEYSGDTATLTLGFSIFRT